MLVGSKYKLSKLENMDCINIHCNGTFLIGELPFLGFGPSTTTGTYWQQQSSSYIARAAAYDVLSLEALGPLYPETMEEVSPETAARARNAAMMELAANGASVEALTPQRVEEVARALLAIEKNSYVSRGCEPCIGVC